MARIITPVSPGQIVTTGPGVLTNIPGTSTTTGPPAGTSTTPRIIYNGKVLDLPQAPWRWQAAPVPLHTTDIALDGTTRTILYDRLDIPVSGAFHPFDQSDALNANLRASLHSWWQWALHGYGWYMTLDSTKIVNTVTTAVSSGTTLVVADPTGITAGIYKLMASYGYALVTVASVSGDTLTLSETPDATFPAGSILRDQNFYKAVVREASRCPIIDLAADERQTYPAPSRFRLEIDFFEDTN